MPSRKYIFQLLYECTTPCLHSAALHHTPSLNYFSPHCWLINSRLAFASWQQVENWLQFPCLQWIWGCFHTVRNLKDRLSSQECCLPVAQFSELSKLPGLTSKSAFQNRRGERSKQQICLCGWVPLSLILFSRRHCWFLAMNSQQFHAPWQGSVLSQLNACVGEFQAV